MPEDDSFSKRIRDILNKDLAKDIKDYYILEAIFIIERLLGSGDNAEGFDFCEECGQKVDDNRCCQNITIEHASSKNYYFGDIKGCNKALARHFLKKAKRHMTNHDSTGT